MIASSSFKELRTSKPPSFHSPLSDVNTEDDLMYPWTELASLLMKRIVFCTMDQRQSYTSKYDREITDSNTV
jgi:hypothetical protein